MYVALNCENGASGLIPTQNLTSACTNPRLYLSHLSNLLSSSHLSPLLGLFLPHTNFNLYIFFFTIRMVCLFFFLCSIPITWLRHDTTKIVSSELPARKRNGPPSQYRSAIISSLRFDIVFSFHQQLAIAATRLRNLTTAARVAMAWHAAPWQCTGLQWAAMPRQRHYVISELGGQSLNDSLNSRRTEGWFQP